METNHTPPVPYAVAMPNGSTPHWGEYFTRGSVPPPRSALKYKGLPLTIARSAAGVNKLPPI